MYNVKTKYISHPSFNKDIDAHDIPYYALLLCLIFPITSDQAYYMLEGSHVTELSQKDKDMIRVYQERMRKSGKIELLEEY